MPTNKESARRIVDAARLSIADPEVTSIEASAKYHVSRSLVTMARVVLRYGTAEDLDSILEGKVGFRVASDTVKKRLTPEQLLELRNRNGEWTTKRRSNEASDSQIWGNLRKAVDLINGLPSAADVAHVVRRNAVRKTYLNEQLLRAAEWMEEFLDTWSKPDVE